MTLGVLILLFVVYQLWGTGIFTARAQENLKNKFEKEQKQYAAENDTVGPVPTTVKKPATPAPTTTTSPYSNARPPIPTPADGDVEGWITIPRIGLHMLFVEGTSRDDLKKGPGHYPGTPLPGTIGNAAIAGHRTTYAHPFWGLDNLVPGDDIIIETFAGTFDYRVSQNWFTVKPSDVWVVANTPDPQLTLTACHPKGSAAQRIVIKAKLVPAKSAPPTKAKHPWSCAPARRAPRSKPVSPTACRVRPAVSCRASPGGSSPRSSGSHGGGRSAAGGIRSRG